MDRRRFPLLAGLCLALAGPARAEMLVCTTSADGKYVAVCSSEPSGEGQTDQVVCKRGRHWAPSDDLTVPTTSDTSSTPTNLTNCFHTLCHIPRHTDTDTAVDQSTSGPPVIYYSSPPSDTGTAQAQQVPEPSSLLLVGLGSLGLACLRRRAAAA